jgi:hypothetical protein
MTHGPVLRDARTTSCRFDNYTQPFEAGGNRFGMLQSA